MTQYTSWSYETWLRAGPRSPSLARVFVLKHLVEHGLAYLSDDVRLVVSELATNVSLHTEVPTFSVLISKDDDGVRLTVTDWAPQFLSPNVRAQAGDVGGRGLAITEALCRSWGVTALPDGGKSVWATFAMVPAM
jgi:anti-sigma regulatory factor (Ser/Thr protein kinase)